ncbi:MAG TPA: M23 family metallopeptidase [Candidatus Acidoferrales bacterium]|nr:M23 family metallopeptidase [Candidatus Acidoferrales bacterium]
MQRKRTDDLLAPSRYSRRRAWAKRIVYLAALVIVIGGFLYLVPRFEWHAPVVHVNLASNVVGLGPFDIEVREKGTGLAALAVTLSAGGADHTILLERYNVGVVTDKRITVQLSPSKMGIKDGPAVLRVSASDRSYWRFFKGNQTKIERNIVLDTTPPAVELVSGDPYVNFGGSGLVAYKVTPDTQKSGVRIGRYFFPGYRMKDGHFAAFFAYPYDLGPGERTVIVAEDAAGNTREMALSYTLKPVRYRKSTLAVDEEFIRNKVAPLLGPNSAEQDPKAVFLKVNRELRQKNEQTIRDICSQSHPEPLWKEPFHQLTNSKVEANFADQRTYIYRGEKIDQAYHLGYDLAVTRNTPVEAANDGIVVFAGDLGIYGNTVVLDHGMGLFTLYSHLSAIEVKRGDKVKQKQALGKTGETGLAAGDHLHYAVLLHGVPVLPTEWWDRKWLKDNVYGKLAG